MAKELSFLEWKFVLYLFHSKKRKKKGNLGKISLFTVPNHKTRLVKHNSSLFKPYLYCFIAIWGRRSKGKKRKEGNLGKILLFTVLNHKT